MLYRDGRLLILTTLLILIAGVAALGSLPNSEDPELTHRLGAIVTRLPGAPALRVDALISSKIEDALFEIEEVDSVRAMSRAGLSLIDVTLYDRVRRSEVDQIWSQVRSKLEELNKTLPEGTIPPVLHDDVDGASTLITALIWDKDSPPMMGIMQRYAEELEDLLRLVPNTEKTAIHGGSREEIHVTVEPETLAGLQMSVSDLAQIISERDSKEPAGRVRGSQSEIGIEVAGGLYSLNRLASLPIATASGTHAVLLRDIARIEKGIADPPSELAIVNGQRAIVVSARMEFSARSEAWTNVALGRLESFKSQLPDGIRFEILFQQSEYTQARLNSLRNSLALGIMLVVGVNFLLMGWRSSIVVSMAIPATLLLALIFMRFLGISIHQMSIIGFIGALGMLIDNAIIVVDDIQQRRRDGLDIDDALHTTLKHLWAPLLASTLTSVLAFMPIALMPGGAGEFLGAMATTVILCLVASYILAMTWIPGIVGRLHSLAENAAEDTIAGRGLSSRWTLPLYKRSLDRAYAYPRRTMGLIALLSTAGVILGIQQEPEVFPKSDRNQFPIQLELPHTASIDATRNTVANVSRRILENPEVTDIYWFVGTSFPTFYYSLVGGLPASPNTANALVTLKDASAVVDVIRRCQNVLDREFPECQAIAWQMSQGEPAQAPIEVSVKGPDLVRLSELSMDLRRRLSETPNVLHTRSTLKDGQAKLVLDIDEAHAFDAKLTNEAVARQLGHSLDGAVGGALLEDTEEIPIRVRIAPGSREHPEQLASLELVGNAPAATDQSRLNWIPLGTLGDLRLEPELSEIHRLDGQRSTTVQGYIPAGLIPSTVYREFEDDIADFAAQLPAGYALDISGEEEIRDESMMNLFTNMGTILLLMATVLVVSMRTFRGAAIITVVAVLSIGFGMGALGLFDITFGFSAVVGLVALIGVSINDSIVVLAGILSNEAAKRGDVAAVKKVVLHATRHVVATSITTMVGFLPLLYSASNIFPPMGVTIGFGVGGATIIALYFTPAAYIFLQSTRFATVVGK